MQDILAFVVFLYALGFSIAVLYCLYSILGCAQRAERARIAAAAANCGEDAGSYSEYQHIKS